MAGYDNRHEVHKDDSHCPANDENPTPCPLVGTGIHEPIDAHLERVHGYSEDTIHGIRVAGCALGVPGAIHPDLAAMFRVHQFILLFQTEETTDA